MTKISFGKIAATSLACAIAIATTPAAAQSRKSQTMVAPQDMGPPPTQSLGGPIRQGNYCWISTDHRGLGYWRTCGSGYESFASASKSQPPQTTPIPEIDAWAAAREADSLMGGGDGGGGGGGDGGGGGGSSN